MTTVIYNKNCGNTHDESKVRYKDLMKITNNLTHNDSEENQNQYNYPIKLEATKEITKISIKNLIACLATCQPSF